MDEEEETEEEGEDEEEEEELWTNITAGSEETSADQLI